MFAILTIEKNAREFTTFAHMTRGRYLMDGMHPLIQFIFLASLSLTFLVIFTMTGMYLVRPLFGITTMDVVMQNALAHPDIVAQNINQLNALKFLQFMSSIGAFLIPAIFFAMLKFPGGDFLMLNRHIRFSLVIMAILILVISAPFISFTYEINQRLVLPSFMSNLEEMMKNSEDAAHSMESLFLKMPTVIDLAVNLILIAIIPALAEELLFRGCVQQVMKEWFRNVHVAIWVTAFIFSFIHFEFYGFLPRLLLGAMLGYLFYWSGSLWVPIIAHTLNNGLQVLLSYLYDHGMIAFNINSDEAVPVYLILVSIVMGAGLLYAFKRISDQRKFIY